MGELPSGTVTFLFTDIEGSTLLWEIAPDAMRVALERHDAVLKAAFQTHNGTVFASGGDGFAVAFAKASDAVASAVHAQRQLSGTAWPDPVVVRVRMGLYTGEASERGGDYFGPPLNRAARLAALASGGAVVCSESTAALVSHDDAWRLVDLGYGQLRGLTSSVRVFGVAADGLDSPIPLADARVVGNLPYSATEFVGRTGEVKRLVEEVTSRRLMTLVGTGGIGKTRLALEVGWAAAPSFPDGAWMVELAPLTDGLAVDDLVAQTLSVRIGDEQSVGAALLAWLAGKRLLLILDNCEHLLEPCADLVGKIAERCRSVSVLATSREPLAARGEQVSRVRSLDPDLEGVELFVDRARLVDESFEPTAHDLATVGTICERLDGIPLAIELAAARVRSLSCDEVLAKLDDRFRLLRGGRRGGLERHQTLRATVSWSHQLLTDDEAAVFDRCAVFAGGFDLAAAAAVCAANEEDVFDALIALVDKSMVAADRAGTSTRYRLLETLRQYGEERLVDRGDLADVSRRHVDHYLAVADFVRSGFESSCQVAAVETFSAEWANFRAALWWALESNDPGSAARIVECTANAAFSTLRHEHGEWAGRVLAELPNDSEDALVVLYGIAAYWAYFAGQHDAALRHIEGGLAIASDPVGRNCFWAWVACTNTHFYLGGNLELATEAANNLRLTALGSPYRELLAEVFDAQVSYGGGAETILAAVDRVCAAASGIDSPTARSFSVGWQAARAIVRGDFLGAVDLFEAAALEAGQIGALALESGWQTGALWALSNVTGDDTAPGRFRHVLQTARAQRDWPNLWTALEILAAYWAATGRLEPAGVLLGHLDATNHRVADIADRREQAASTVAALPDSTRWTAIGAAMSPDELVSYAADQLGRERTA